MKISPVNERRLRGRVKRTAVLSLLQVGLVVAFIFSPLDVRAEETTRKVSGSTKESAKDHWAFCVPVRPELSSTKHADEARSAIDRFVWARLDAEGLAPAPPADRHALIRRLSLDITGLPPSMEDVDAFVNDPAPDAYERVVDRLLASPRYGERWGLWWLDLARYADSNGYESDRTRSIWPWRDWVIEAFNADMPFDQFTIEQIAGDMLPDATLAQQIATGFHRNTWINEEGGHDWEQFRYESVVDRVHTTGTVFLGLTITCAQCHDHKYDPISQREYWEIFAFLNNADEPDSWVPDAGIQRRQEEVDVEIARRIADRAESFPPLPAPMSWTVVRPSIVESVKGATLSIQDDASILASGDNPVKETYVVTAATPLERIDAFRLEVLPGGDRGDIPVGRAEDGNFVITDLRIRIAPLRAEGDPTLYNWTPVTFMSAMEDRESFAREDHVIEQAFDSDPKSGWAGDRASTDLRTPRDVSFAPAKPIGFAGGTRIEFRIEQNHGRSLAMNRFRFSAGVAKPDGELAKFSDAQSRQRHLDKEFSAWLDQPPNRPLAWNLLDPVTATSYGNATMTELEDRSILVTGDRPEVDTYEVVYRTDARRISGFRLEAIPDARLPNYGPGRGSLIGDGAFVVTEFRVELVRDGSLKPIEFARAYANYHSGSHRIENSIDGNKLTSWFIGGGGVGERHVAVFEAKRPYELEPGTRLQVTILQNFVHQQTLGRFRLFVTGDQAPLHSDARPVSFDAMLAKGAESRTGEDRKILRDYFLSVAPALRLYNDKIQKLRDSRPRFPTTLVFKEREDARKRTTHIHVRGEYQRPGEEVAAAVPVVLHPFPEDGPRNRLTFAEWLVSDGNPLIGRVIANQLWQAFFGRGLVSTPENFGVQGAPPSHPELLDWLAVELRAGGWSLKSLHRQIVTSAVYRQASKVSSELLKRDPENILLARGPRLRVDAETIRDIALEASGLLVGTLGGPSVFPPQPAEAGETFGGFRWKDSIGAARYRRGLYTFRKRGGPYASFATFDAPPPNTCAMSRARSNTPLQALAQLNDLVVVEASRALAVRVLRAGPADLTVRIHHAFRLVLTRPPNKTELSALVEFYERQRERFESGSLDPVAVFGASSGSAELQDLAAMTTVARLLLNLDEAINKE